MFHPKVVHAAVALAAGAILGCGTPAGAFDAGTLPPPAPQPLGCPTLGISGLSPASGQNGVDHTIIISGAGFNNGATVEFVYRPAAGPSVTIPALDTTVLSSSRIRATLPAPASGNYDVRITRGGNDDCAVSHTLRNGFRAAPISSGLFVDCTAPNIPSVGTSLNGVEARRIVSADFDCDGDADALIGVKQGPGIFLEGVPDTNGDGVTNFVWRSDVATIADARLEDMLAVDLDGDGDQDIVYADSAGPPAGGLHILSNEGDCSGTFFFVDVTASRLPTQRSGMADVAVGDIDGDGLLDIAGTAITLNEGVVYVQQSNGNFGALSLGLTPVTLASGGSTDVVIADLDNDGLGDIANGAALPSAGSDGVSTSLIIHNDGVGFSDWTARCGLDVGVSPELKGTTNFVGAGDLDLDGDLDLVWDSAASSLVLLNQFDLTGPGECGFSRTATNFEGFNSKMTLLVDIDTDGNLDVWNGTGHFLENDGSGGLADTWPDVLALGLGVSMMGVATPDLDGDGILDLLATENQAPQIVCAIQLP